MQISLSKDTNTDNPKEISVHVMVSAVDDEQAEFVESHSFNLQEIQEGRSIAVDLFNLKPKSANLRKYGKKLFWALFSQDESSPACCLLQDILQPHSKGRIMLQLNDDQDLDIIPWEYAWGNNAYLTNQCIFARLHKPKGSQPSNFSYNPKGPQLSHIPKEPQPSHNPQPSRNPKGLSPSHNPKGSQSSRNPNGTQLSHNPKGPQSSRNANGPQSSQGPRPSHNPKGPQPSPNPKPSPNPQSSRNQKGPQPLHNPSIFSHNPKGPPPSKLPLLPLRIVTVVPDPIVLPDDSNAKQFPDLHLNDQSQTLCDEYEKKNRTVLLQRVFPPTVAQMNKLLRGKPEMATVLHFMGHCGSQNDGARALIFEDHDTGRLNFADVSRIDTIMNLRLAFLSACDTRHIARDMAENGIPYTIGSHCFLPDDLARKFESKFYQYLASGYTVEKAMLEARASMNDPKNTRQRDYFPGAMVLYSSTFREADGAFKCEEGLPMVEHHMPPNNLEVIPTTSRFRGRKKELVELGAVLRRIVNRGTQSAAVFTIEGISGQGKTVFAMEAMRRTAHLFPGGIFVWQFDRMAMSVIEYLRRLIEVIFPDEVQSRLNIRSSSDNDVQVLGSAIIKEFMHHPTCLLFLDHADTLKRAVAVDQEAVKLGAWLQEIASTSNIAVKILATSSGPLGWSSEMRIHLDGLDIDSGVELFIRNLDTQVRQRMEKEENTTQLLHDLVRLVDGHPLCLESLGHAVGLPQHRNTTLEEFVGEDFSTMLVDGSYGQRNLGTLFRPTIDALSTQLRLLLYMCSLFTGPITEGVLGFVRHFVEYVDASKEEIDSSEQIARNLQRLYGRGLLSKKQDEGYRIQLALREGARLCNSMLKFGLRLPIPGLVNDTFVIGVVGPSPHVKSIVLEWQLRRIQANAQRELKTRGFGIHYYSIGNEGLRIFKIDGMVGDSIDHDSLARVAPQQDASYRRLAVFIYNTSGSNHDSLPRFCKEQIIPLVQEKQMTFIFCLNHTDDKFVERSRTTSVLTKKATEILQTSLEKTHWIIRTEAPHGIAQPNVNSASNWSVDLGSRIVKPPYRKRNDNVRMEGSFIGRANDLDILDELLDGPEQYITITGFGGVGKTSLALRAFEYFNSGSALALSLAGAPRVSQVILKIAEFFAIDNKGLTDPEQQSKVLQNLEGKGTILLYLDNMEDVKLAMESRDSGTKEEARKLINFFKGLPANVKILATSKVALGWPKEYLFDLAGLEPREGMLVFRQWTPQRSRARDTDTDEQSGMDLSRVTDGHPLSLLLLGGMFDNCKEPIDQFVNKVRERLPAAVNKEFVNERHESIDACIDYSFCYLNDELQTFLGQLNAWNVPFTSTLVMRALQDDPAALSASLVANNLHKLWQRSWLNRRKYEVDPMLGDWRPNIIENETEFYSLHPRLHDFLNHHFNNVEATLPNDAEIQFYTALCYGVGFGVANDLAKQIDWCTKAANNGHLEAQLALAGCYQGGCGVRTDPVKAFDWMLKAAEAGSKQAQSEIVDYYRQGYGVVKDEERATFWEKGVEGNYTAPPLISFDLSLPLMHRFAFGGDVEMVRSLCTRISDVNVRDRTERTPLHVAAQSGHIDLIDELLYECNADISPKDIYGRTPLHLAAQSGHPEPVWFFVTACGVDPNITSNGNWTPLHYAANEGHLEVVKVLLADAKRDANARDKWLQTPLHLASKNGCVEVVKVLLAESKADANARKEDDWTPLHFAAQNGHVEIVKVLLADSKADANAKNKDGDTPLHLAAKGGHVEVVKLLVVEFGADAYIKNDEEWTPLRPAAENGHVEIVKLLAAALAGLPTLTTLNIKDNSIGDEGARALAESLKQNITLTELNLEVNRIDHDGARALAESLKQNTTLTTLDIGSNSIGDEGACGLAESLKQNTTLTQLNLENNEIGFEGARSLAESLKQNTILTQLNLEQNSIGDKGACALAGSLKQNSTLTLLNLKGNGVGDEGACALDESLKQNTTLTQLNLKGYYIDEEGVKWNMIVTQLSYKGNRIGAEGACALAESLKQNSNLTQLNLQRNCIGNDGACALAESLKQNTILTQLNLKWNSIGDEGARYLAEFLMQNTTLNQLNLENNKIGFEGARSLAESLKQNAILTLLNLGRNRIGIEGARALAGSLNQNTTLTQLNLKHNEIGAEGAHAFAESPNQNTTLTRLNLEWNLIGDEGARALAKFLELNSTLTQLNLEGNRIGNVGVCALAESLEQNTTLTKLNLEYNEIGAEGGSALAKSLKRNTTLTQLNLEWNDIGAEGARTLAKSLEQNTTLTQLNLEWNRIGATCVRDLAESLKQNTTLTELNLEHNEIGASH